MFDAILIATDLSDTSERALDTALQLARAHGSALHLVHVIRDPATEPWAVDAFGVDFDALLEHVHSRAQREVTARVERLTLPGGKRARVLVGAPAAEILRYANSHRCRSDRGWFTRATFDPTGLPGQCRRSGSSRGVLPGAGGSACGMRAAGRGRCRLIRVAAVSQRSLRLRTC